MIQCLIKKNAAVDKAVGVMEIEFSGINAGITAF